MRFFILVLLSVLLLGCASSSAPKDVNYIESKQMSELIEAENPQSVRTETGTLKGWIVIKNRSKKKIMVEGRATFLGASDEPIEAPTGWIPLFVEVESEGTLKFLSMTTAAKKVKIDLREGNK